MPESHSLERQLANLRALLQDDKVRLGMFLGAGCPLGVYDDKDEKSLRLIPDVAALTERVTKELSKASSREKDSALPLDAWNQIIEDCKEDDFSPNVEHALTEIRTITQRRGRSSVLNISKDDLVHLDQSICRIILSAVDKPLPKHRCSYDRLATWAAGIERLHPIDIFTPNYDLLLEEAFERHPLPHFDGFVGSREPFFDLSSIEYDAIPNRWTRIWKLHGSINWRRSTIGHGEDPDQRIIRVSGTANADEVMIYPSHLKYSQSRRMPYLAMIDRLRGFFSSAHSPRDKDRHNDATCSRLVVCGYSFSDDHINEVILDGLRANPNSHCFALLFDQIDKYPRAISYARKRSNLTVLAKDEAVIGTIRRPYSSSTGNHPPRGSWVSYMENAAGPDAEAGDLEGRLTISNLGDFHHFAMFLEHICGGQPDAITADKS